MRNFIFSGFLAVALGYALPYAPAYADDTFRIEMGKKDLSSHSNEELRRRVNDLERAVAQLQGRLAHLESQSRGVIAAPVMVAPAAKDWTCHMDSFGKTYFVTDRTRASALAQVLKKCADATSSIHCRESDVKCENE